MASKREQAGLPQEGKLRNVALQAMRSITLPASNDGINSAVAELLDLTPEQGSVMHSNGTQSKLAYETAWARTALKTAGAAENVGRALWALTEEGSTIAPDVVDQRYESYLAELKTKRPGQQGTTAESPPLELGDDKVLEDEFDWSVALIDRLMQMSPRVLSTCPARCCKQLDFTMSPSHVRPVTVGLTRLLCTDRKG